MVSSIAFAVACSGDPTESDSGRFVRNTAIDLLISDPDNAEDELLSAIDFVSYRITCPASGLTPYDDSVDITGNFEIVEERDPPVWTMTTDLPPGNCVITMWVFYEDEVVCSGTDNLPIIEGDSLNKFNITLLCNLSADPPSGDADIDADFDTVIGNFCPQLVWLSAVPSVVDPSATPTSSVEVFAFDDDGTCGDNCDPQSCDFSTNPPVCTPGPDLGLETTFFTKTGVGSFDDPNAASTNFNCDPLFPGPVEVCVRAADGDDECDRIRCSTVTCPDLCMNVDCDDGNDCTRDACDPLTGACTNDPVPDGIACDSCTSTCQAGSCDPAIPFTADQVGTSFLFSGTLQTLNTTFVNPYSGMTYQAVGDFLVNSSSYLGTSLNDTLIGTAIRDLLVSQDPLGTQRVCGVDFILPFNALDLMLLADADVTHGPMSFDGGADGDVIWADAGDDTLNGNDGDDLLDGGPGNDTISGGNGNDVITLWPGSGFDTILGNGNDDTLQIDAEQNQITIVPSANPSFVFDILYLGTPMAEISGIELLVLNDATIDLQACTGGTCALCGNGALNGGEECDDGNADAGDGCAPDCTSEY